jgi:hypothetical protein
LFKAARRTNRPIRPKPLIPIVLVMLSSVVSAVLIQGRLPLNERGQFDHDTRF